METSKTIPNQTKKLKGNISFQSSHLFLTFTQAWSTYLLNDPDDFVYDLYMLMGHHLILIPCCYRGSYRYSVAKKEEPEKFLVINLQDSAIQRINLPAFLKRDPLHDYTLVKYKENQMIKIHKNFELITVESFERISSLIS